MMGLERLDERAMGWEAGTTRATHRCWDLCMPGETVDGNLTCRTFRVKIHTALQQINETLQSSFKPNTHDLHT